MASQMCRGYQSFHYDFKNKIRDNFLQEWYSQVEESSTALHYINFKCILEREPYLSLGIYEKTNIQCSPHKLFVELGRHNGISYQQHICPFYAQKKLKMIIILYLYVLYMQI